MAGVNNSLDRIRKLACWIVLFGLGLANIATGKATNQCTATQMQCANYRCVLAEYFCDATNQCKATQIQCANYRCVYAEYFCDGDDDCGDTSDEPVGCHSGTCGTDDFRCAHGNCINKSLVCDGTNNCRDKSDEKNCLSTSLCDGGSMFQCVNGVCIDDRLVCDGHDHCGDSSDESYSCGLSTVPEVDNGYVDGLDNQNMIQVTLGDISSGGCVLPENYTDYGKKYDSGDHIPVGTRISAYCVHDFVEEPQNVTCLADGSFDPNFTECTAIDWTGVFKVIGYIVLVVVVIVIASVVCIACMKCIAKCNWDLQSQYNASPLVNGGSISVGRSESTSISDYQSPYSARQGVNEGVHGAARRGCSQTVVNTAPTDMFDCRSRYNANQGVNGGASNDASRGPLLTWGNTAPPVMPDHHRQYNTSLGVNGGVSRDANWGPFQTMANSAPSVMPDYQSPYNACRGVNEGVSRGTRWGQVQILSNPVPPAMPGNQNFNNQSVNDGVQPVGRSQTVTYSAPLLMPDYPNRFSAGGMVYDGGARDASDGRLQTVPNISPPLSAQTTSNREELKFKNTYANIDINTMSDAV